MDIVKFTTNAMQRSPAPHKVFIQSCDFEFDNVERTWKDAEAYCVSKEGHLASASSPYDWQRLLEFVNVNGYDWIWLGGTDEGRWENG